MLRLFPTKQYSRLAQLSREVQKQPLKGTTPSRKSLDQFLSGNTTDLAIFDYSDKAIYGGVPHERVVVFTDGHNSFLHLFSPVQGSKNRYSVFEENNFPVHLGELAVDIYVDAKMTELGLLENATPVIA